MKTKKKNEEEKEAKNQGWKLSDSLGEDEAL